jgi:D-alanyl-D-alanine carboxypeptidase
MRLRILIFAFLISLPFWWGINFLAKNLKDYFFFNFYPQASLSILEIKLQKPIRNFKIENLNLGAKSALALLIDQNQNQKILYQKNIDQKLPIASLTKLMSALIVIENYDLLKITKISKKALEQEEEIGKFRVGEEFLVFDLLHSMLIESSNDAAFALAEIMGVEEFVSKMNFEAKNLLMEDTHFSDPTGLDDEKSYSTAKDLAKLTSYLLKNNPLVFEILSKKEYPLRLADGSFHHQVLSTNQMLGSKRITAGKTGWSEKAQGCLILVAKAPAQQGTLIMIVLGAKDRFLEMRKLQNWLYQAYFWQ